MTVFAHDLRQTDEVIQMVGGASVVIKLLEGIEKASGKDIASKIIEFIEENASGGKTKTKGKG